LFVGTKSLPSRWVIDGGARRSSSTSTFTVSHLL